MNLYKISRDPLAVDYDENIGFVIRADSEEGCREIAKAHRSDEHGSCWDSAEVEALAIDVPGEYGVVLRSNKELDRAMKTLSELANQIIEEWAKPKGLCAQTESQALIQHDKTVEEVGELLHEIEQYENWSHSVNYDRMSGTRNRIKLEAGDVLVTLCIQCEIQSYSIKDALILVSASQYQPDFPISYYVRAVRGWIEADAAKMVKLEMGVIAIALEALIKPYDLTLLECLEAAWEKIRDRCSVTITTPNGGSVAVKSVADYRELCRVHGMEVDLSVARSLESEALPNV